MAKAVGLEIHERGVRAVEVTGSGKNFKIGRYTEREVTPRGGVPDPEELHAALAEIFKHYSKNHVIASLEASDTVVREIPVPFKTDDQIRKVVKYEAEHHLHDCDADDVVVQYAKVGESPEGTNLLVFAVRKDVIGRRIEFARAAGVEPLAMDLDALAYVGAVKAAGLIEESPTCVLLDIGHRSTGMVFIVDGTVRALRSVRLGVDSITHGMAREMDIDAGEAGEKVREIAGEEGGDLFVPIEPGAARPETAKGHAELERDVFHQKRDEFAGRLKREYVRSVAALRGGASPARVLATGPGLGVPGLLELLATRLGVPVEPFRPSESFSCKLDGQKEQFDENGAVALGLALKGIGHDALELDFRQEELRVANKFELLKNSLAVTVTLLFFGLLAFSGHCVYKMRQLERERFEPIVDSAYKPFADVVAAYNGLGNMIEARHQVDPNAVERGGPKPEAVRRFLQALDRMKRNLHTIVGDAKGLPQITSALQVWNEVFAIVGKLHEQIDFIDFETIEITQKQVTLAMILPDVEAGQRLEEGLKKVDFLSEMKLDEWGASPLSGTNLQRITFVFKRLER
ncbi:MAG TPA: pilus assembly protein PilM [Planctomycetota bacterium]|nr:pilus assembly protein PilM [Planctomycetota bacterium]